MKQLTPQTVYIPTEMEQAIIKGGVSATVHFHDDHEMWFDIQQEKYCLSKEELVDLFTIAWNDGHISDSLAVPLNIQRDNFIDNILP